MESLNGLRQRFNQLEGDNRRVERALLVLVALAGVALTVVTPTLAAALCMPPVEVKTVLAQVGGWFEDYNTQAPHSALGMRSPREYRAVALRAAFDAATASTATPHLPQKARSSSGPLSGYPPKIGVEAARATS